MSLQTQNAVPITHPYYCSCYNFQQFLIKEPQQQCKVLLVSLIFITLMGCVISAIASNQFYWASTGAITVKDVFMVVCGTLLMFHVLDTIGQILVAYTNFLNQSIQHSDDKTK